MKRIAIATVLTLMAMASCRKVEVTNHVVVSGTTKDDADIPELVAKNPVYIPTDSLYVVSNPVGDEMTLLVTSLQGVVNKIDARVILSTHEHENWANKILASEPKAKSITPEQFVRRFIGYARGYVLTDLHVPFTVDMTVAGPLNAVILTQSMADRYAKDLKCLIDVRGRNEEWLYRLVKKNKDLFNLNGVIQPVPRNSMMCVDNAIATNMIAFRAEGNVELARKFYSLLTPNSPRLGYGAPYVNELLDVKLAAEYGLYTIAADWAVNYSFLTKYKLPAEPFRQQAKTLPQNNSAHYVMLMWSDGDNLDYAIKSMAWGGKYLDAKEYADFKQKKINWEIPPTLKGMPLVYDHYRNHLPEDYYFIAATSGAGYTYPSLHKDLAAYARKSSEIIEESGLEYLCILDDCDFKTTGKAALETMLQNMPCIKGVFFMEFANYAGGAGESYLINGVPVISFRHRLWEGLDPYPEVVERINNASRDITSMDAYSAVVVHAWSYSMADVKDFIDRLDDDVILVTADEFVKLIKQNVL